MSDKKKPEQIFYSVEEVIYILDITRRAFSNILKKSDEQYVKIGKNYVFTKKQVEQLKNRPNQRRKRKKGK